MRPVAASLQVTDTDPGGRGRALAAAGRTRTAPSYFWGNPPTFGAAGTSRAKPDEGMNWPPRTNCLHSIQPRPRKIPFCSDVVRCPVCLGKGYVPAGIYNVAGALSWTASTANVEPCRTCDGLGMVR